MHQYRIGDIVFAQCIGEDPWPAKISKIMESHSKGGIVYKVDFVNHKSTAVVEGFRLSAYNERTVEEQTKRQKTRGNAGKSVLNAIKAANKLVKQASQSEQHKQKKAEASETDIRQSRSIIRHVLELQNEDEEWNPPRKDPKEERNKSFTPYEHSPKHSPVQLASEERKDAVVDQPQSPLSDFQFQYLSHQTFQYSPNSSVDCNLSNTAPEHSVSQPKIEEESEQIMEESHQNLLNQADQPKVDMQFSTEQGKLSYIISYLPTALQVYNQMPEPTQMEQFASLLDVIYTRLAEKSNIPLSIKEKLQFTTFMRLVRGLESKPSILARMVNCVLRYEKNEPQIISCFSLEYIALREKLKCLCLMKPFIFFPQEAQQILIAYIRKCEVSV